MIANEKLEKKLNEKNAYCHSVQICCLTILYQTTKS